MRRRIIASAVVIGLTATVAGASAGAKPAHHARPVYVAAKGCMGHVRKPRTIIIACADANFYAARLRYSSYGGAQAHATGDLVDNTCTPNCVSGKFITYAGSITLGDIASCQGRLYYERIWWQFHGARPFPDGSQEIRPAACA